MPLRAISLHVCDVRLSHPGSGQRDRPSRIHYSPSVLLRELLRHTRNDGHLPALDHTLLSRFDIHRDVPTRAVPCSRGLDFRPLSEGLPRLALPRTEHDSSVLIPVIWHCLASQHFLRRVEYGARHLLALVGEPRLVRYGWAIGY